MLFVQIIQIIATFYYVLRVPISSDVYSSNVFSQKSELQKKNSAAEKNDQYNRAIASWDRWNQQLANEYENSSN